MIKFNGYGVNTINGIEVVSILFPNGTVVGFSPSATDADIRVDAKVTIRPDGVLDTVNGYLPVNEVFMLVNDLLKAEMDECVKGKVLPVKYTSGEHTPISVKVEIARALAIFPHSPLGIIGDFILKYGMTSHGRLVLGGRLPL